MNRFPPRLAAYPVRTQFFLAYGLIGCLLPYLAIHLNRDIGLRESTIGWLLSLSSLAVVFSPVFVTALADTRVSGRTLLGWLFLGCSACMLAMAWFGTPWAAFVFFGIHVFLFVSVLPLQDGLNFTIQRRREREGRTTTPYHKIRVWGTVGFIVPSLFLPLLFSLGVGLTAMLYLAAAYGILGFLNTRRLPLVHPGAGAEAEISDRAKPRLPTIEAAHVLLRPRVFLFCVALFIGNMASAAYFGFYPLYLTRVIGFSDSMAGLVFNVGVVFEIAFLLAYGKAVERLGTRGVMIIATVAMTARMLLLAAFPFAGVAVASQMLHGFVVIALQIGPITYLNSLAGDRFRNSIQGLYMMVIAGISRVIGNIWAGQLAGVDLILVYFVAGGFCFLATLVLALSMRGQPRDPAPL